MRARLERWAYLLRAGFWFVPTLMLVLAAALALVLLYTDRRVDPGLRSSIAWAYSGGPEGARSLLSTIAGSMITAASVTFSLAAVALSIASQQYGSRVLHNFMRDRVTQVLLGTFTSTFLYCVLVVRTIRGSNFDSGFVPAISVTVAIALALVSLVLLIYFVHHISTSIQASHIVLVIGRDMHAAIPRLYPSTTGERQEGPGDLERFPSHGSLPVLVVESGYLQRVDLDTLFAVARRRDLAIELTLKPGDHAISGSEAARIWGDGLPDDRDRKRITGAFLFGGERTSEQDIRYQFQQLTDVVVRALSPGINDPFTAINGIDQLASGLSQFARRPRTAERRQDERGALRLIVPKPHLEELLESTVGHIAIYAAGDRFVMGRLYRALGVIEKDLQGEAELRSLQRLTEDLHRREAAKAVV